MLFAAQATQPSPNPKNLKGINFSEKAEIVGLVDQLSNSASDPYVASLPLMASAGLGDEKRYEISRTQMLKALDKKSDTWPSWMQKDSFKAWMLGRVLLAAESMKDNKLISEKKVELSKILKKITESDSFSTWAQGYLATLSKAEYESSKKRMVSDAIQLSQKCKANPTDHNALSDALWACVMNLSAAASANDKETYELIKEQIKSITEAETVSKGLEKGLLRTTASNDYPAWAFAKTRLAAATMLDEQLYHDIEHTLVTSIENSKKAGATAEFVLAVIDNQLSIQAGKKLQAKVNPAPAKVR